MRFTYVILIDCGAGLKEASSSVAVVVYIESRSSGANPFSSCNLFLLISGNGTPARGSCLSLVFGRSVGRLRVVAYINYVGIIKQKDFVPHVLGPMSRGRKKGRDSLISIW